MNVGSELAAKAFLVVGFMALGGLWTLVKVRYLGKNNGGDDQPRLPAEALSAEARSQGEARPNVTLWLLVIGLAAVLWGQGVWLLVGDAVVLATALMLWLRLYDRFGREGQRQ